jgi:hypothetical protein
MPQLDFVSFHYILNTLSFSYLFVYAVINLFLLKPIFKYIYIFYAYPKAISLKLTLLSSLYRSKVVFSGLSLQIHIRPLEKLRGKVKRRWTWFEYIPKLAALR